MAEHVWSVLCNHPILDRDTKSLSLLLTLDRIMLLVESQEAFDALIESGKEAVNVRFFLVSLWVRSDYSVPEKALAVFQIIGPSGRELKVSEQVQEIPVDLTNSTGYQSRVSFDGFPIIDGTGVYWIEVGILDSAKASPKRVARVPINITLKDEQYSPPKRIAAPKPAPKRKPKRRSAKKRR